MKALRNLMKKVSRGEGGFTLIELLIVIIILGILAAVVAFNVGGFLGAGTCQVAQTQKASLETAIIAGMADHSIGNITNDTINGGDAGKAPSEITISYTGGSFNLGTYLQNPIKGNWTYGSTGNITSGSFTAGGKTADYYANGTWGGTACV